MYFKELGKIEYGEYRVTDITKRTNIVQELLKNQDFFFKYMLNSGDTPEGIAYNFYNDVNLHWIIFMVNEIYDPLYQWYLTYQEVVAYSKLKYGDPDFQYTQYWLFDGVKYKIQPDITEDPNGLAEAVTNLDTEVITNDARQEIKLVYPEYIDYIVAEFKELV